MQLEFVRYEKRNRIAYITINRPEVMNALHPPANEELSRVWDDFATDDATWVAILTGAGDRAFSAGNDLKWTATHGMPRMPKGGFGGIVFRDDIWKPLIAAVNGVALGGGLEIALACDIVVAAENARLGLPEPRVGLMAAAGGVHRLPRHVPLKLAMGMILTGRHVPAAEAFRIGLVNAVLPQADLLPHCEKVAGEMLAKGPIALRFAMDAAIRGLETDLDHGLTQESVAFGLLSATEDMREGLKAFLEKRKPRFTGK